MNDELHPSARYLDHVFEEFKARNRSRTMTLGSSNVCWRVVVMLVPTSLNGL